MQNIELKDIQKEASDRAITMMVAVALARSHQNFDVPLDALNSTLDQLKEDFRKISEARPTPAPQTLAKLGLDEAGFCDLAVTSFSKKVSEASLLATAILLSESRPGHSE